MIEQPNHEFLKKLVNWQPEEISIAPSDISVSVPDEAGGEKEYIYPDTMPSDVIVLNTSADFGEKLAPSYQERFIEGIEEVKASRFEEVEVEVGIPNILTGKIKIKRAPKKTIKRYTEKQKE
jgi:hypothetical protein